MQLQTKTELWAETRPLLDSMHRVLSELRSLGFTVVEWQLHPVGMHLLQRQITRRVRRWGGTLEWGGIALGAPLIMDASLCAREMRAVVRREVGCLHV